MNVFHIFKYLTIDPVNFSTKAKILSLIACFCSIFFIALMTKIFSSWPSHPLIVASMGASVIILFFIPNSPLAQPWPFVGGQIISALVGVYCALNISDPTTAQASAVGGSILLMLLFRCLHPPGAATSLTPVMAGSSITTLGYSFVLIPVAINVFSLLVLAIIINRLVLKRSYPSPLPTQQETRQRHISSAPSHQIGFSEQDINSALKSTDVFIDMTHSELSLLLAKIETNAFKRIKGNISCADIMIKEVITVEYGTEAEQAWELMRKHKLKAMPVIDRASRIIGIITWNDFFKFIDLNAYENIQEKFRNFIQRTSDVTASKPEFVGYIMTTSVITVQDSDHIVELIKLMPLQGHRQIPVVNKEARLVGMVYQSNLIAALYNQQLAKT
jgi:CBS domain-containing membrane protein